MAEKTISLKHEAFCLEYLKDFNATAAYIRTGYRAKDADVAGPALLGKIGIKKRISELCSEVLGAAKEDLKVRILREYESLGFSRVSDFLDDNFQIDPDSIRGISAGAVKEVIVQTQISGGREKIETRTHKIKLHDKLPALAQLAKYTELIKEDSPFQGDFTIFFKKKEDEGKK